MVRDIALPLGVVRDIALPWVVSCKRGTLLSKKYGFVQEGHIYRKRYGFVQEGHTFLDIALPLGMAGDIAMPRGWLGDG